ncbi:MAG: DEAD/DEAH box helicase, partial [Lachnospiraceae bacterium]|nr:DEAD/DEAH box helicase [Lachnospiraceae bacterium]
EETLKNAEHAQVWITSYDLLKRDLERYENNGFSYQIIDEAQVIKNHSTQSAKAVKAIRAEHRFALTGTPIENRLSELWSIFDYLMPGYLYPYAYFREELEIPIIKNEDEQAARRLRRLMKPFVLRRLKQEVLKELPEKLETVVYSRMETEQKQLYAAYASKVRAELSQKTPEEYRENKIQILSALMRLRQLCCDPALCYDNYEGGSAKLNTCMELIGEGLEAGHRFLLFSQFTTMLERIKMELEKKGVPYFMLTGSTPKQDRVLMAERFNEGEGGVFLISLKAGGTGLNLTGADMVIHYDPWWNLAAQNQATDRAHRIGQKNKVTVWKLVAKGTIEENIIRLQESKHKLAEQILGGGEGGLASLTQEEILALLNEFPD